MAQHIANKNDPHDTLKAAKQVRIVAFLPAHPEVYNDSDLVVVTTTGKLYRVSKPEGAEGATLEEIPLGVGATPLAGRDFDLSTEDGITYALGTIIEILGGTPHV